MIKKGYLILPVILIILLSTISFALEISGEDDSSSQIHISDSQNTIDSDNSQVTKASDDSIVILDSNTLDSSTEVSTIATAASKDTHTFVVNLYYPTGQASNQAQTSIMIQQIKSESTIDQCKQANLSFKITNPSASTQTYSFTVKDFSGTAYIAPNIMLSSKQSKIIDYALSPDCSLNGDMNPKIFVETTDGSEEATVPAVLHVKPGNYIDETKCEYYFNQTVCNSNYYISLYAGNSYELDLSKWFYDPDEDKLTYEYKNGPNLNINIKKTIAKITPISGWNGAEQVTFYANDGKGGKAISKTFYVHVLPKKESFSFLDWITSFF